MKHQQRRTYEVMRSHHIELIEIGDNFHKATIVDIKMYTKEESLDPVWLALGIGLCSIIGGGVVS